MHDDELVAVIIPAFNAAHTLGDTLASVRRQTHRHLEIIVVDDGSHDRTAEIAEAHAAEDGRVRLIRQENGGVARARNAGAAASRAEYLAPVDADDLWHPEKIARQLAALRAAGPEGGYAYTFSRHIDAAGRATHDDGHYIEGAAFLRSILQNFVGNGSTLLIRRVAFESVGGYESALRDQAGWQGCEDYLLQVLIARHWRVVCVPAYLTGYRKLEESMSKARRRTVGSRCAAYDMIARRVPEVPAEILNAARAMTLARTAVRRSLRLQRGALAMLRAAFAADAPTATRESAREVWNIPAVRLARIGARPADDRPHFRDLSPDQPLRVRKPLPLAGRLAALATRDEEFFVPARPPLVPPLTPETPHRHERRV
jgi:hypothetical protein